jgi:tetratricopeptide (TPR) repeat protein
MIPLSVSPINTREDVLNISLNEPSTLLLDIDHLVKNDESGFFNRGATITTAYQLIEKLKNSFEQQNLPLHQPISTSKCTILLQVGKYYYDRLEYRKAIAYYEKSLKIAQNIEDRQNAGKAYNHLGVAHEVLGEYYKAIEYHEKHLKIAIDLDDQVGEGSAYGNLGIAYDSLGECRKSIEYHEKHLQIVIDLNDRAGEGRAHGNLSRQCV